MFKKLLCGTAVLALSGHAALASQVIVNGQPLAVGTHNVSYGHAVSYGHSAASGDCCAQCCGPAPAAVTYETAPAAISYETAPAITYETAPAMTYEAAPITYETLPATSYETLPVTTYEAAPVTTYSPAPVTTYTPAPVTPVYQPVAQVKPAPMVKHAKKKGWGSQVYVGARGGLSIADDTDFGFGAGTIGNEYKTGGYNVAAVVGWRNRLSPRLGYRVEGELGYQESEVDVHTAGATSFDDTSFGDTKTLYGFANLYLDVPVFAGINGVVGGGVGAGRVEFDDHGVNALGVAMDDEDTVFGYHLDAGVSYDINERLSLEAMYRYTSFVDVELEAVDGTTSETDVDSHNVVVGARYGF